jgi:hypothetical protein
VRHPLLVLAWVSLFGLLFGCNAILGNQDEIQTATDAGGRRDTTAEDVAPETANSDGTAPPDAKGDAGADSRADSASSDTGVPVPCFFSKTSPQTPPCAVGVCCFTPPTQLVCVAKSACPPQSTITCTDAAQCAAMQVCCGAFNSSRTFTGSAQCLDGMTCMNQANSGVLCESTAKCPLGHNTSCSATNAPNIQTCM